MPISFSGTELSVAEWLAYGIGGVALMAECHAYRLQDGQQFRRWTGGSALLWSLMYLGLDAITAALTMGAVPPLFEPSCRAASSGEGISALSAACFCSCLPA